MELISNLDENQISNMLSLLRRLKYKVRLENSNVIDADYCHPSAMPQFHVVLNKGTNHRLTVNEQQILLVY